MPKVKFNEVDDEQQFALLPEGDYAAEIVKVEETTTKKNNDPMWKVQFKVIDGEHAGSSIFSYFVFNEGGYGNIKKLYKEIGGFNLSKAHDCQPADIEGEKLIISVVIGEYTNKDGNKVKNNQIPFGGFKSIESDDQWD